MTKAVPINRRNFLKWVGLGSAGLVTVVVASRIFKEQPPTIKEQLPIILDNTSFSNFETTRKVIKEEIYQPLFDEFNNGINNPR